MAEWSNAAVSKTVARGNPGREFKSHPLRQIFEENVADLNLERDLKPTRAPLVRARAADFGGGSANAEPGEKKSHPLRLITFVLLCIVFVSLRAKRSNLVKDCHG